MAKEKVEISETAYLTCGCRANNESLSKDIYAKFWMNNKSREFVNDYLKEVSPVENELLSLRNRFFLDELKSFFRLHKNSVFINLGAGFSNYPFLLNSNHRFCEVDCSEIINVKINKIFEFGERGVFPRRDITFFELNLDKQDELHKLKKRLKNWLGESVSFVLIEGLIYYLNDENSAELLEIIRKIQTPKSRIGVISWPPKFKKYPVFNRFCNFVAKTMDQKSEKYIFHNPNEFRKLRDYKLIKQTNYIQLSKKYDVNLPKDKDFFWEDLFILEKIKQPNYCP